MVPDGLTLTLDTNPPDGFQKDLGDRIVAFMTQTVQGGTLNRFALALREADGTLAGGLSGAMYWDWLFVAALWVDEDHRGRGAGRVLLAAAEAHAAKAGCHSVWLDTFQASGFYEKLGYSVFGRLEDYPEGQTRCFLRKRLGNS